MLSQMLVLMGSVEVLKEATKGRSRWLRKAPLRISHPSCALLDGQASVLLFAAGSAGQGAVAHRAVERSAAADGGAGSAVQALYEAFCNHRARQHGSALPAGGRAPYFFMPIDFQGGPLGKCSAIIDLPQFSHLSPNFGLCSILLQGSVDPSIS